VYLRGRLLACAEGNPASRDDARGDDGLEQVHHGERRDPRCEGGSRRKLPDYHELRPPKEISDGDRGDDGEKRRGSLGKPRAGESCAQPRPNTSGRHKSQDESPGGADKPGKAAHGACKYRGAKSADDKIRKRGGEGLLRVERGDDAEALRAVNLIRERAGIAPRTTINRDQVRHERKVELAFENHRWWDIRRWHIADQLLNAKQFKALNPYLVWEDGKDISQMKYIFKIEDAPKDPRTFLPKLYYERIPADAISTNPNIKQNPGY